VPAASPSLGSQRLRQSQPGQRVHANPWLLLLQQCGFCLAQGLQQEVALLLKLLTLLSCTGAGNSAMDTTTP